MKPNSTNKFRVALINESVNNNDNKGKRHNILPVLTMLIILIAASSVTGFAAESDFSQPIDVSADRSEYNEKTGKQSLSGNVEIRQGSILINADSIEVILKDNKLSVIEGRGSPIKFQQQNELGELITGSCERISYDALNGILTLTGNAHLKQPKQELRSESIKFNSISQSVVAEGGQSGRVTITIQPPDRGQ